jgi:transposase
MSDRFDHTLDRRLKTKTDVAEVSDAVTPVHRIEVITGAGQRRRWSVHDKARIIAESLKPGANVSEVARRHGMRPQQLFTWRREVRAAAPPPNTPQSVSRPRDRHARSEAVPAFSPVVLAVAAPPAPMGTGAPPSRGGADVGGRLEIAINDAVVRIIGQVEGAALVTVLRAVRRAS